MEKISNITEVCQTYKMTQILARKPAVENNEKQKTGLSYLTQYVSKCKKIFVWLKLEAILQDRCLQAS